MATVAKRRSDHVAKRNKRLRKEMRTSAWMDAWEVEAVGRALMTVMQPNLAAPDESGMPIEQALEMVEVWKARSNGLEALPHAVESTTALVQVSLRDYSQQNTSVTELRLAYSSAIVRCINGLADALQQQRFVAAPVSTLCGQLGIPSWLVDIRHEASHNSLPTLGVLRLGAAALLNYWKSEYWIPSCPNWKKSETSMSDDADKEEESQSQQAVNYLLQYKACACATDASAASADNTTTSSTSDNSTKQKQKSSKPVATTRPFDTFFGDGDSSSSDDEDDWEDPIMGSLWGPNLGTSENRFAVLEPLKHKSNNKKKEKKPKAPLQQKKQPGEMYPFDYAKMFITMVSPQEGFSAAVTFLVWGGIGGAPSGRGVLIPGSVASFPATQQGIVKSWQRYSPLVQVLGRSWPGFCPCLLVHLVDFVLTIEDTVVQQSTVDAGSARKLYFLSAWIRLLLSQQFVSKLDREFASKNKKNGSSTELAFAKFSHLEKLKYPLNSICDRCCEYSDHPELRKASQDVLQSLEEIMGSERFRNFGVPGIGPPPAEPHHMGEPSFPETSQVPSVSPETTVASATPRQAMNGCKTSLEDMEALLSDDDESGISNGSPQQDIIQHDGKKPESAQKTDGLEDEKEIDATDDPRMAEKRPTWVRCATWDACSIGTLPGYPV
jgi:hypothetical protein